MANLSYISVATKITPEAYAQLKSICKQYGFTLYDMLQMLCECLIRFMDTEHNLSEDLLRIIRMFEDLPGWKAAMRLTEPLKDVEIVEAFYVIRRKGKTSSRLVHVTRPILESDAEGWMVTYNIQTQLERFIELTNSSLYKHLRCLSVELGTESILDTIHTIANLYKDNPDEGELRLQFENNDWHEGAKTTRDTVYKRRHSHSMDFIEQQTIFDNNNQ